MKGREPSLGITMSKREESTGQTVRPCSHKCTCWNDCLEPLLLQKARAVEHSSGGYSIAIFVSFNI